MTYTLHFLPQVEEDVLEGHAWYESKSPGLGEEFLRTFYACAAEIPRNPKICSEVHKKIRRRLLRRFPYAVYYLISKDKIIVFGLFHCARDPRTVKRKMSDRSNPGNNQH